MRALVGLGNPGAQYDATRHNIGFVCIDAVAKALGDPTWKRFQDAEVAEVRVAGGKCFLVKPQQFMNNSGRPIRALADYYNIEPSDICIVADDVYVAPGSARIRQSGGDGGHNGWKSVLATLDADTFWRVRIGVGVFDQKPESKTHQPALDAYVLSRMPKHDEHSVKKLIDNMVPNLIEWLEHGTLSQETIHI